MPNKARNHEECRSALCLLCMGKSKEMRKFNLNTQSIIKEHFIHGYNPEDPRLPTSLCSTCRKVTQEYLDGDLTRKITVYDYSAVGVPPPATRSSPSCSCIVCEKARCTITPKTCSKRGRPLSQSDDTVPALPHKQKIARVCRTCLTFVGRGKEHHCTKSTRHQNLTSLATESHTEGAEKIASAIIKDKCDGRSKSSPISLSTSTGRPLRILVSPETSKSHQILSCDQLSKIQVEMNLSSNQTLKLASHIRVATKDRCSIESNLKSNLKKISHSLDTYFDVEKLEFVQMKGQGENKLVQLEKTTVYCNDLNGLVTHVLEKRNYANSAADDDIIFKLCIDGGAGFLKLCLSIISFRRHEENVQLVKSYQRSRYSEGVAARKLKDTSVKKMFILAIVPDLQENYNNVQKLLSQVNLIGNNTQSTMPKTVVATDLKLANILIGLMAHGSCHPCSWCDCEKLNLSNKGELHTLASLTDKFWSWQNAGGDVSSAKKYGNVIHLPLLKGDPNDRIIDILPPPELHLLLGPVNTIYNALVKEWPDALNWAIRCHVEREAMHGGSFNGNSCNILLSKVDILRSMAPLHCLKYVACFDAFKAVVSACYGQFLHPDYVKLINVFKDTYMSLGINVTPKVHAVFFHIQDFCQFKQEGLSRWSEQACEAVHSDFKATWAKYKVPVIHPDYGAKLLFAVREYNSRHL